MNVSQHKVTGLADGTDNTDAVTVQQLTAVKNDTTNGLANKANVDASNIGANLKGSNGTSAAPAEQITLNENAWGKALGTGSVTEQNGQLVTGGTVFNALQNQKNDLTDKLSVNAGWGINIDKTQGNTISLERNLGTNNGNTNKGTGKVKFEANGTNSLILGGQADTFDNNNVKAGTDGQYSVLVGGRNNYIDSKGTSAVIAGGFRNSASGIESGVFGGGKNTASGPNSAVLGGSSNKASGEYSTVIGGGDRFENYGGNHAEGTLSTIIGGYHNDTWSGSENSVIVGGRSNSTYYTDSVIVGGGYNVTYTNNANVFGGYGNWAGNNTTISGGVENITLAYQAYALSGYANQVSGYLATSLGGQNQKVIGNYSTAIGGASTGKTAENATAIGSQAVVTAKNGLALGYKATADKEGTISFGHDKGDISGYDSKIKLEYGSYSLSDIQKYLVGATSGEDSRDVVYTPTYYESAEYNRLVKVADGQDAHDAVVMEQLKPYTKSDASNIGSNLKTYTVGDDGETITQAEASDADKTKNKNAWGAALGTGKVADPKATGETGAEQNGSEQLVTGGTVFNETRISAKDDNNQDKTYNYLDVNASAGKNLETLDSALKTVSDSHTVLTVEGNTAGTGKDEKTKEDVYTGKNILLHESTDTQTGKVTYDMKLSKDIVLGDTTHGNGGSLNVYSDTTEGNNLSNHVSINGSTISVNYPNTADGTTSDVRGVILGVGKEDGKPDGYIAFNNVEGGYTYLHASTDASDDKKGRLEYVGNDGNKKYIANLDDVSTAVNNAKTKYYSVNDKNSLTNKILPTVTGLDSNADNKGAKGMGSLASGFSTEADGVLSTVSGSYSGVINEGSVPYFGVYDVRGTAAVSYGAANVNKNTAQSGEFSGVANSTIGQVNDVTDSNAAITIGAGNTISNSYRDVNIDLGDVYSNLHNPEALRQLMKDAVKESGGQVLVMGGGNEVDSAYMSQVTGVGNKVKGNQVKVKNAKTGEMEWSTDTNKETSIKDYNAEKSSQLNYVDGFYNTVINGKSDYVIGAHNTVEGNSVDTNQSNIIFGDNHKLTNQKNNVIIGSSDTADDETTVSNVVAIGHNAKVSVEGGVAIGSGSVVASTEKVSGYDPTTKTQSTDKTSHVWNATTGAVSIGAADGTVTRQLNGVAAGTNDTDAVNVAQLKKLGDNTVQYELNTNKGKITLAGQQGTTITNVKSALDGAKDAEGKDATIATATGDDLKNAANLGDLQKVYNDVNEKADKASASHTALTVEGGTSAGTKDEKTQQDVYAGKNILLHESTDENGKVTYDLKLAKDINIGKPGKDGEDGKIGIDGKDGHIGLNGSDGITVRGLDGKDGTPGKDGVTITGPKGEAGKDGIDGKVGISGKDGNDAVSISGKDGVGHIGLTGPAGTNGMNGADGKPGTSIDITVKNGYDGKTGTDGKDGVKGENGVDGTSLTRIVYTDKTGEHQVATMEDGLKFKGDDSKEIAKKLNNTMEIIGGADSKNLTEGNIGVNSTKEGKLKVQLSKNLTGMNSTTYTTTTGEGDSATTSTTVVNGNGLTITNGPSITNKGVDGGNKVITNVGSGIEKDANGKYTVTDQNKGNAANVGDVQNMVNDAKKELTNGTNGLNNKANIDASNIGANLKDANGKAASTEAQKANAEKWGSAIGTGEIKADDGRMVTGKTVYDEVRPKEDGNYVQKDKTTGENLSALDSKIGKLDETKKYNYIDSGKDVSISDNLTKLDTQVKNNADAIQKNSESIQDITNNVKNLSDNAVQYDKDSNKTKVTLGGEGGTTITNVKDGALSDSSTDAVNGKQLYNEQQAREVADTAITEKVTNNTSEITKIKNGDFTDASKTAIHNIAKDAVEVVNGKNTTVTKVEGTDMTPTKYAVNVEGKGKVASGDTGLISGDTLYKEVHVDKDGSYIKGSQSVGQNLSALDTGLKTTSDLIHTNDKGDTIQIGGNSTATKIDVSGKDANGNTTGRVITGVVSDANDPNSAANVGYVNGLTAANTQQIYRDMNNAYSRLDTNINRAAAGSNALAALHPLDFDPADKASFAVGYGHYHNANAAAVGAFYQPNANTMVNMGISLGNGDPGFNAGVSFKIGKGSTYNGVSKAEMAQTIHDQAAEISTIKANDAAKDKRIDALEKENQEMKKQIQEILARLNG